MRPNESIAARLISAKRSKAEDAATPELLDNYADALRVLGRFPEAATYAQLAYTKAQQVSDRVVMEQSMLELARIYRDEHDFSRSAIHDGGSGTHAAARSASQNTMPLLASLRTGRCWPRQRETLLQRCDS